MPKIIKNGAVVEDDWTLLADDDDLGSAPAIVSLSRWQSEREGLITHSGAIGVLLDSTDDPEELTKDVSMLPLIAINFPEFKDGRGYSSARILRDRLGYTGELRAIGDVLRDQLFYLKRCGFNSFVIREDRDPEDALKAFEDFRNTYQGATDNPLPLFRRRTG